MTVASLVAGLAVAVSFPQVASGAAAAGPGQSPEASVAAQPVPARPSGADPDLAVDWSKRKTVEKGALPPAGAVDLTVGALPDLGAKPVTGGVPVSLAVEPEGAMPPLRSRQEAVLAGEKPDGSPAQAARLAAAEKVIPPVPQGRAVRVESLGPAASTSLGDSLFAFRLAAASAKDSAGGLRIRVDTKDFAAGRAADFAARLRIYAYPECVLTTPDAPGCSLAVPLRSVNQGDALIASLPVEPGTAAPVAQPATQPTAQPDATDPAVASATSAQPSTSPSASPSAGRAASGTGGEAAAVSGAALSSGVVYAVAAGSSSEKGDYKATSMSLSDSWAVGEQSGAFTYSYPVPMAPSVGGSAPSLSFTYDSGAVDGRTSASNSQASWVGSGWDLEPGYIERQYASCANDGIPGNDTRVTELCWKSPYSSGTGAAAQAPVYLHMGGATTELIWLSGNQYRAADDSGWHFTLNTGATNGDNDGEYWLAQSPDGHNYYFGLGRQRTTNRATSSVATVPVYANNTGEPCYSSGGCTTQAYRWGVDQVNDKNDNEISYFWDNEKNSYAKRGTTTTEYTRALHVERIEYGFQRDSETATPPAQVLFDRAGRCTQSMVEDDPMNTPWTGSCPSTSSSPSSWPDVPTDQLCSASCPSSLNSPTFFTSKRLDAIRSQVYNTATSTYETKFRTQARMGLPDPGDGSDPSLWMDWIQRRGYDGSNATSPITNFNGVNYKNRVDYNRRVDVLSMNMRRITEVKNELGGRIVVAYTRPNACPDTGYNGTGWSTWYGQASGNWDNNVWDCFNVWHDPDGATGPQVSGFGIYHKYLVGSVRLVDETMAGPDEVYGYSYGGKPAWAFNDDPLVPNTDETWGQWRGYGTVTTTHGNGAVPETTISTYFRGMDGNRNANGAAADSVSLTDLNGTVWTDLPSRKGRALQRRSYNENNTEVGSSVQHWTPDMTIDGPGWHNANFLNETRTYSRQRVSNPGTGNDTWRERIVDRTFNGYGLPDTVTDYNDGTTSADNTCTNIDYGGVQDAWGGYNYLVNFPDDVRTYLGACGTGQLTKRVQTLYDGAASVAANAANDGDPTATITYRSTSATLRAEKTFDVFGRIKTETTPNQVAQTTPKRTTYVYAPATGYPTGGVTVTNPAGHVTVTYPNLWHSGASKIKDANGKWTWIDYDAFARPTSVWLPTEGGSSTKPTGAASMKFTYPAAVTSPAQASTPRVVLSETLQSGTTYLKSYAYVDGFGRDRETQVPTPYSVGGRMVTIKRYDSRGMLAGEAPPQYNSAAAGSGQLNPAIADLTSYTHYDYDSQSNPAAWQHYASGTIDRQGTTADKGDRTETVPPAGGKTISYYDVQGRTSKVEEYTSSTAHNDTTYAYADLAAGPKVTITDAAGKVTSYQADLAGRRTQSVDANTGTTTYSYDNNSNLTGTSDPSGTSATSYDVLDRPTNKQLTPTSGTQYTAAAWTYDPAGALGELASSTGTTVSTIGASTVSLATTKTVTGYDGRYRPTGLKTTLPTNTLLGTGLSGLNYTESYTYDSADHTTSTSYPAIGGLPAETATSGYIAAGTPNTLTLSGGTDLVTSTAFTGSGLLNGRVFGSGAKRNIDWNMSWRSPSEVQAYYTDGGGASVFWQRDAYTRDALGNVTSITDKVPTTQQAQCFTYDARSRLTQAWTTNPATTPCATVPAETATTWNSGTSPYRVKYSYGATQNITAVNTGAISGSTTAWTNRPYTYADTAHPGALTGISPSVAASTGSDSFAYDSAGRMTTRTINGTSTTNGWDPATQLTSTNVTAGAGVGTGYRYAYDADGQRSLKVTTTGVTAYLGNTEVTGTGTNLASLAGTRHYTLAGTTVATRTGSGAPAYLFNDVQGSASLSVTSGAPATATVKRQRYAPYGAARGTTNQLPIERGWLGQVEDDATGLTYLNARYYDPATARFISPDPLLNLTSPATHNPYTYALGNPVTYSDPSGL